MDNKSKKGYQDRSKINTKEKYEMDYWKNKFGVSGQQLAGAVRVVGNGAKKVEAYLKGKK